VTSQRSSNKSTKKAKLSAPTTFTRVKNVTEAKNRYELVNTFALTTGSIYTAPHGLITQGTEDYQRIGKAVTSRYDDIRWQVRTDPGMYITYRVLIGVWKYNQNLPLVNADDILEATGSIPYNILRPVNGTSSANCVILHDKIYKGRTPAFTGANVGYMDDVQQVTINYRATQVYQNLSNTSSANWTKFIMFIAADSTSDLNISYGINTWFTDT